jgi:hypothetical protein
VKRDLEVLESQAASQFAKHEAQAAEQQEEYEATCEQLDEERSGLQGELRGLENDMQYVAQVATNIGSRLQEAELHRKRALDALQKINYLQEFAHTQNPSNLPAVFHDDARLAEAVVSMQAPMRWVTKDY